MRTKVIVNDQVQVKASDGSVINPATDETLAAVRDRLPTALGPNGGVKAEVIGVVEVANDTGAPVPVSGTVDAVGPLTDEELRAAPVPVSADALPLPAGAGTEATLAALLATQANDVRYYEVTLDVVRTDFNAFGGAATFDVCWVKVLLYDGTDDTCTVKLGSAASPAIPLSTLLRPETETLFAQGRVAGAQILVTSAVQAGKKVRFLVGVRV